MPFQTSTRILAIQGEAMEVSLGRKLTPAGQSQEKLHWGTFPVAGRFSAPAARFVAGSSGGRRVLYLVALDHESLAAQTAASQYLESISETCWNGMGGIWFVKSDLTAVEIRDELRRIVGPNDRVAVAFLAGFAAWHGFDEDSEKWLLKHL
jgi:hypothetical protein